MILKNWTVAPFDKETVKRMTDEQKLTTFLSLMLSIKGLCKKDQLDKFFGNQMYFYDPFMFKDMDKAAARIRTAINNDEKICIYGDYDADGITSTVMLYEYLEMQGANVIYYIPDRHKEGYGLNCDALERLKAENVSLIITVDNGVVAFDQIDFANELAIDIVVTDHHEPNEDKLPNAVAVVNPHRPDCQSKFKLFSGVGVAFYLILALENNKSLNEDLFKSYCDLICIGTIADIVSLTDANRDFVKFAIYYFDKYCRPGIAELKRVANINPKRFGSSDIGFKLAPRINAAGRLNQTQKAIDLLLCKDPEKAEALAVELERLNSQRQSIGEDIKDRVEELLKDNPHIIDNNRVIIVWDEGLHPGVIGIVASNLMQKYGKPVIIASIDPESGVATASGRSIKGFSIFDAVNSVSDLLLKFGGHSSAVGFSVKAENLPELAERINSFARLNYDFMPLVELDIACKINPTVLNFTFAEEISYLEPFGKDNEKPLIGLYNLRLVEIRHLANGRHQKLTFRKGSVVVEAINFFCTDVEFGYKIGDYLDIAVCLEVSHYKRTYSLLTIVKEIRCSKLDYDDIFKQKYLFFKFKNREPITTSLKSFIPTRDDFACVYRYLKKTHCEDRKLDIILFKLKNYNIGYFKFNLILHAMQELGLLDFQQQADEYKIWLNDTVQQKVNLSKSEILTYIKSL